MTSLRNAVVVAATLDRATERIVAYLAERGVATNVLFFKVYRREEQLLLGRSWLIDPAATQSTATTSPDRARDPWNGEWYVSFGHDQRRDWNEARQYGHVSAGGGAWYTGTLAQLSAGDRIWVRVPKRGYVGVGIVKGPRLPLRDHVIEGRPAMEVLNTIPPEADTEDEDTQEYVVPVHWLETVPLERAIHRTGMFGNQNTVAAPKAPAWRTTVEQLRDVFTRWNDAPPS